MGNTTTEAVTKPCIGAGAGVPPLDLSIAKQNSAPVEPGRTACPNSGDAGVGAHKSPKKPKPLEKAKRDKREKACKAQGDATVEPGTTPCTNGRDAGVVAPKPHKKRKHLENAKAEGVTKPCMGADAVAPALGPCTQKPSGAKVEEGTAPSANGGDAAVATSKAHKRKRGCPPDDSATDSPHPKQPKKKHSPPTDGESHAPEPSPAAAHSTYTFPPVKALAVALERIHKPASSPSPTPAEPCEVSTTKIGDVTLRPFPAGPAANATAEVSSTQVSGPMSPTSKFAKPPNVIPPSPKLSHVSPSPKIVPQPPPFTLTPTLHPEEMTGKIARRDSGDFRDFRDFREPLPVFLSTTSAEPTGSKLAVTKPSPYPYSTSTASVTLPPPPPSPVLCPFPRPC